MNSRITIGARVREVASGRIGFVVDYVPPIEETDATHLVTFDDGTVCEWLPESALVEADTRDDEPVTPEQASWVVFGEYFRATDADDRENVVGAARGGVCLTHPKANLRMATLARMGLVRRDTRSPAWLATPLGIAFATWLESVRGGEGVVA